MEENPYKSPAESGAKTPLLARLLTFAIVAVLLWPLSWMLGRLIIPPDDVALRWSVIVYIAAIAIWATYLASRPSEQ
jgi:hypothetical protein